MEEGHSSVHHPDDGGSTVSSQLLGQSLIKAQVYNTDAYTWSKNNNRLHLDLAQLSKTNPLPQQVKNKQINPKHYWQICYHPIILHGELMSLNVTFFPLTTS